VTAPDVVTPPAPKSRHGARANVVKLLGGLIAILAIALCVKTLAGQWSSIRQALLHADLAWIGVALVCSAGSMTGLGLLWWRCLRLFGANPTRREAASWYFGGELGKYLPGGIWSVLGRGELAQRGGVGRSTAYATTLISYFAMCVAAAVSCGLLAPFVAAESGGLGWGWLLLALIPAGVIGVHPVITRPIFALGARLTKGRLELRPQSWRAMLLLIGSAVPAWLLLGAASAAIAQGLGYHQHPAQVAFAAIAAWIIGFLAVPVPAGAGLRELVFVAIGGLAGAPATAVAALARLLLIVVDAGGGLIGLWNARRSPMRRQPSPDN
jgi:uncharacterized membrane protein YbhN (UPF0104 family)